MEEATGLVSLPCFLQEAESVSPTSSAGFKSSQRTTLNKEKAIWGEVASQAWPQVP